MRGKGRYERYVATNDLSGEFYIAGHDPDSGKNIDGRTRLKVCKNCLGKLNYRHAGRTRDQITISDANAQQIAKLRWEQGWLGL